MPRSAGRSRPRPSRRKARGHRSRARNVGPYAGACDTRSELQRLPDSKLRWLAASSVGLGAGFNFASAPRLIVAAGLAPVLIMGAAVALRPIVPTL